MKKETVSGAVPAENESTGKTNAQAKTEGQKVVRKVATPVKKKKIIIVTGQGGSGNKSQRQTGSYSSSSKGGYAGADRQGTSPSSRTQQRGSSSRQASSQSGAGSAPYHPIKPKTAPSQVSGDYHKPIPKSDTPVRRTESAKTTPRQEQEAASAPVRAPEVTVTAKEENLAVTAKKEEAAVAAAPKEEVSSALQESEKAASPVQQQESTPSVSSPSVPQKESSAVPGGSETPKEKAPASLENKDGEKKEGRRDESSSASNESGRGRSNANTHTGNTRRDKGEGKGYSNREGNREGGRKEGTSYEKRYDANQTGKSYSQGASSQGRREGNRDAGRSFGQNGKREGTSYEKHFEAGSSQKGAGRSGSLQGARASQNSQGGDFSQSQGKRRNPNGIARDRHNKKDVAFEQNEQRERKNRSGRFIKPVVEKVEAPEEQIKVITIPEKLTIGALADAMHLKPAELIKKLFLAGKAMTLNSEVTYEEAENIAADYDILCEKEEKVDVIHELLKEEEESEENMKDRPPVICVMGHVDHGKTSILDYIRHSRVTEKEAGGITQAIGAYTVDVQDRRITFLDTPGHEAFTAMRLRGAKSTDIAVLVVAADDGVMPQTVEAINHAKAAGVEIIVAVNKIDRADANPERVREQLSKYELIPTSWGGHTEFVNVSAKTGEGIEDLLDTILLQADIMELKANPDRLARGLVLEAKLDRGRGPVANVLVQKGTLHVGDFISAGPAFGKVRAMINDKGKNVKEALPSDPVVVLGLSDVPSAGEVLVAHSNNDEARSYAETYKAHHKEELVEENVMSMNVEDLFDQMREGKMKELELIVKADVQGSVEALTASLLKLSNDEVKVRIIHSAVGGINESDVDLAAASNAAIIGFNVAPNPIAKSNAEHNGVSIHLYKIIYQAIDDVDAALKGMLAPVYEEKITGHAEVRQLFRSGKIGNIAGCMVLDGIIERDACVRVTREKDKIFEGNLASLKRFKDDVKEVRAGYDCGLVFEGFDSMNVGDQIEAYKMVEVPREEVIARKEREAAKKEREASRQQR